MTSLYCAILPNGEYATNTLVDVPYYCTVPYADIHRHCLYYFDKKQKIAEVTVPDDADVRFTNFVDKINVVKEYGITDISFIKNNPKLLEQVLEYAIKNNDIEILDRIETFTDDITKIFEHEMFHKVPESLWEWYDKKREQKNLSQANIRGLVVANNIKILDWLLQNGYNFKTISEDANITSDVLSILAPLGPSNMYPGSANAYEWFKNNAEAVGFDNVLSLTNVQIEQLTKEALRYRNYKFIDMFKQDLPTNNTEQLENIILNSCWDDYAAFEWYHASGYGKGIQKYLDNCGQVNDDFNVKWLVDNGYKMNKKVIYKISCDYEDIAELNEKLKKTGCKMLMQHIKCYIMPI
jgi:hypothetical protein